MTAPPMPRPQQDLCLNCGAVLSGRWCAACGQRRLDPAERSVRHHLREFWDNLVGLDRRFPRSLRALFLRPGQLEQAWVIDGTRRRYLSPTALFLGANLLYFVLPGWGLRDLTVGLAAQSRQWYGPLAQRLIEARLAARGLDLATYAQAYDAETVNLAKLLLIVHAPLLALAMQALMRRAADRDGSRWLYADHLAGALHFTAMLLLLGMAAPAIVAGAWWPLQFTGLIDEAGFGALGITALYGYLFWWFYAYQRRAWNEPRLLALGKAALMFAAFAVAHLLVYRALQFLLTYALT